MPAAATPTTLPTATGLPVVAELAAHALRNTSGTGAVVALPYEFACVTFELIVTAGTGVIGDTLNVYIQQSVDGEANWDDVVAFAQLLGGPASEVQAASLGVWPADALGEVHTQTDAGLGAGTVRKLVLGRRFRAKWVVTAGGGGVSSWTFQVVAVPRTSR